ncbi:MAG: hypothetical protein ABI895_42860, partial [Deltaproteobacteria bacterium]
LLLPLFCDGAGAAERTNERRYEALPALIKAALIDSALTVAGLLSLPEGVRGRGRARRTAAPLCPVSCGAQPPLTHTGSGCHFLPEVSVTDP